MKLISILVRYLLLVILAFLFLFSALPESLLSFLTLQLTNFLLSLVYKTTLSGNFILVFHSGEIYFLEIISACVAVSAYFLLLILNLLTPMNKKQRFSTLFYSLSVLFLVNVLRILLFGVLFVSDFKYFDLSHKLFWYFSSIILVVLIWFSSVKIAGLRGIPFYTDLKTLLSLKK